MFWTEENTLEIKTNQSVILSFKINIESLAVDNIAEISALILHQVPYLKNEKTAGIHNVHGADSGNGWQRDDSNDAIFYPSRRNSLLLQIPYKIAKTVIQDLNNFTTQVANKTLVLSTPKIKPLTKCNTILARYVVSNNLDESEFLIQINKKLQKLNIKVEKMLCGKSHIINTNDGVLKTRSLLLVDLSINDSLLLQASGIGDFKLLGCGLFLPHKSIINL